MFQPVCLFTSLLLGVVRCQDLDFTMKRAPDDISCGHIHCVANISLTVINLAIFNITEGNKPVKLASVSVFAPEVIVDPSKVHVINATGSISKFDWVLDVEFLKDIDCLYGTFQCKLDFVNMDGKPGVLRKNLAPATEDNATILYNLAKGVTQLKVHPEETDRQMKALKKDSVVLKKVLDSVLLTVSRFDGLLNSTLDRKKRCGRFCHRGMPHTSPRAYFGLENKGQALCDTVTDGGGWVIIQRRVRGDVDFYKGWEDYKKGFGTPGTDFWIGNDVIHDLTSQGYNQLRIDMVYNNIKYFAVYSNFVLADESSAYAITVSGFSGNVWDAMEYNNGGKFSTFDRDNDGYGGSCAVHYHGAWWYNYCSWSNLNGAWGVSGFSGISWYFPPWNTLSFTEMKLRYIEK